MVLLKQWLDTFKKKYWDINYTLSEKIAVKFNSCLQYQYLRNILSTNKLSWYPSIGGWERKNKVVLNSTKIYALKSLTFNTYLPYFIYAF